MGYIVGMDLWAIAMATMVAGSFGYLLGDLRGAMRRYAAEDLANEEFENLFVLRVPDKTAQQSNTSQALSAFVTDDRSPTFQNSRHPIYADMPPLEQLRAQAREILDSDNVWEEPAAFEELEGVASLAHDPSDGLIGRYRSSIDELRRANELQCNLFSSAAGHLELCLGPRLTGSTPDHLQVSFETLANGSAQGRGRSASSHFSTVRFD